LGSAANFSSSCFLFLRTTALFHCLLLTTISHLLPLLSSLSLFYLPLSVSQRSELRRRSTTVTDFQGTFILPIPPYVLSTHVLAIFSCMITMIQLYMRSFLWLLQIHNPSLDRFDFPRFRSSRCLFPTCHRPLRGASVIFFPFLFREENIVRSLCFLFLYHHSLLFRCLFGAGF